MGIGAINEGYSEWRLLSKYEKSGFDTTEGFIARRETDSSSQTTAYTYWVDGRQYSGERREQFDKRYSLTREQRQAVQLEWEAADVAQQGKIIQIYYRREDPSQSRLDRPQEQNYIMPCILLIFGVFFVSFAAIGFYLMFIDEHVRK